MNISQTEDTFFYERRTQWCENFKKEFDNSGVCFDGNFYPGVGNIEIGKNYRIMSNSLGLIYQRP